MDGKFFPRRQTGAAVVLAEGAINHLIEDA